MSKEEFVPMIIHCCECQQEFTFTAGEQEFYSEKKFTPPKRCLKCRTARKIRRERGQT